VVDALGPFLVAGDCNRWREEHWGWQIRRWRGRLGGPKLPDPAGMVEPDPARRRRRRSRIWRGDRRWRAWRGRLWDPVRAGL